MPETCTTPPQPSGWAIAAITGTIAITWALTAHGQDLAVIAMANAAER
jgi:precorrin-6B methylase 2